MEPLLILYVKELAECSTTSSLLQDDDDDSQTMSANQRRRSWWHWVGASSKTYRAGYIEGGFMHLSLLQCNCNSYDLLQDKDEGKRTNKEANFILTNKVLSLSHERWEKVAIAKIGAPQSLQDCDISGQGSLWNCAHKGSASIRGFLTPIIQIHTTIFQMFSPSSSTIAMETCMFCGPWDMTALCELMWA